MHVSVLSPYLSVLKIQTQRTVNKRLDEWRWHWQGRIQLTDVLNSIFFSCSSLNMIMYIYIVAVSELSDAVTNCCSSVTREAVWNLVNKIKV